MNYDKLLIEAEEENLIVKEKNLWSSKGRINGNRIAIKRSLPETEKACVLAEELGHYFTTVGNILDQTDINNRKQEKVARKWAVNKLLDIEDLIAAVKNGCEYLCDIAEYLNVTEDFLNEAIEFFRCRYGYSYSNGENQIIFNDRGFYIK